MSRGSALLLLAAATAGGSTAYANGGTVHEGIVGGQTVEPGQWPDAVAVLGTNGTCSGTLIAPNVVLTAGHCAGIKPEQIIANTIDYAKDGGTRVRVAKTVAYPSWQTEYDVSVLMLESPIASITPRKVGTACTFHGFARQTNVHLVGFGATDMAGQSSNTQLKEAMTTVVDPDCSGGKGCKKAVAPGGEFVAGGTGTADSCFGDSGGPVYLDTDSGPVVVGAVSRGVDGSATPCGGGGIYVRTDKLIAWIEDTTGAAIATDECDGTPYTSDLPDPADDQVGCSATHGRGGLGAIAGVGLALVGLVRKRGR